MKVISIDKAISIWMFTGGIMIFFMILIGGITRLTGSGLSIVEWNVISGTIPPLNEKDWSIAFEKYKQFPQYNKINLDLNLTGFKSIFFWEYIHRLLGRAIGLVFLIPFIIFYVKGNIRGSLRARLILIFFLGILQAFAGWFMVQSGLIDNPNVSHYRLAVHLVIALVLLSLVLITAIETAPYIIKKEKLRFEGNIILIRILLLVVFVQVLYGAFVAGKKAGFSHNTFPLMGNSLVPAEALIMQPLYFNFIENGVTLQLVHRSLGILLFLIVLIMMLSKMIMGGLTKNTFTVLFFMVFIQVCLGVFTLILHVPVYMALLHQALGILVFLLVTLMNYKFKNLHLGKSLNS